jgi:hypothetical protein
MSARQWRAGCWTALGLSALVAASALAHRPRVLVSGQRFVVEDVLISAALYGEFKGSGDLFEVQLEPDNPVALPVEILVPQRDQLRSHRPLFAIVGAGLPAPTADEERLLPRALPPGMGVLLGRYARADREVIFESFTRRVFWTNGVTAYVLPAGDVRIWIWSPDATLGRFVLGFGVEEGGQDLGDLIDNWSTYAY